jgi:predicted ATP-dependent serine protease
VRYLCTDCRVETSEHQCYKCGGYKAIMNEVEAQDYLGYDWFEEEPQ